MHELAQWMETLWPYIAGIAGVLAFVIKLIHSKIEKIENKIEKVERDLNDSNKLIIRLNEASFTEEKLKEVLKHVINNLTGTISALSSRLDFTQKFLEERILDIKLTLDKIIEIKPKKEDD